MSGTFVAVVGPSGAGKDSLMNFARERLEPSGLIHVVRRVVTRQADGDSEDHDSLDEAAFAQAERDGAFALTWGAHGLRYGLPIGLEDDLSAGRIVVANLSRAMIPQLIERYADAVVVAVSAEREVIEQRLADRGRETAQSIQNRMERRVSDRLPASTIRIDNSGTLEVAGMQFVALLEDLARQARRA
ncbi:phosphonate metabolism protein/1,5-bisphosphokinase (PRPP-forming) PhnN [Devosia sp. J2-20]|uniref:phosphonate metabolism protein/1,5-bisphosphokinase (PRPP-forming) PhnN n=1 Tax=Devosia sp. J2-20 TaxID=3026161 RepID=UPI00249C4F32|nr:phosphonate metabolism protein/1,5-bisphosphokinase (PRPP-forming) PhnN [Devosia sp. J2-20]WDQ97703.1 phosphonate metabolism protein/1,5-bisphosphokinase (PRPP-forming) PhnN [Devosia sp. J2-20]